VTRSHLDAAAGHSGDVGEERSLRVGPVRHEDYFGKEGLSVAVRREDHVPCPHS
jgi:hypothetical protein